VAPGRHHRVMIQERVVAAGHERGGLMNNIHCDYDFHFHCSLGVLCTATEHISRSQVQIA